MNRNRRKNNNHEPHELHERGGRDFNHERHEKHERIFSWERRGLRPLCGSWLILFLFVLGIAAVSLGGCDLAGEEEVAGAEEPPPFTIGWDYTGARADNGFSVDSTTNTATGEAYAINMDVGPAVFKIATPFTGYVVHDMPPGLTVTAECTNGQEVKFTLSGTANPPLPAPQPGRIPNIYEVMTIELKNAGFVRGRPDGEEGVLSPKIKIAVGPALTGTVSITGTPQMGQTLTANTSALGGTGIISYCWVRDGNWIFDHSTTSNPTWVLEANDVGKEISVRVMRQFNSRWVTSAGVRVTP